MAVKDAAKLWVWLLVLLSCTCHDIPLELQYLNPTAGVVFYTSTVFA